MMYTTAFGVCCVYDGNNDMKAVVYTHGDWDTVKRWLLKEYGVTACFAWNLKETFGFTVRMHEEWVKDPPRKTEPDPNDMFAYLVSSGEGWFKDKHKEHTVRLDFDDEDAKTMWLLRSPVPPKDF